MRKILLTLVSALLLCANFNAMAATINGGTTFYLDPGPWNVDNAWFAMYLCNGSSTSEWVKMTDEDGDGKFVGIVPNGQSHNNVIFVRMDKNKTDLSWDSKWNQTNDLEWDGAKNLYTITGWGGGDGNWSTYTTPTLPTTVELRGADNGWAEGAEVMTQSDEIFTLTSTLTQGYGFKIVIDGNWYTTGADVNSGTTYTLSTSGGNSTWKGATGKVDIVVDFSNISQPKLTITEVVVETPAITSFTAEPAEITLGESVTLTSTTENTTNEVVYTVNEEVVTSPWTPDAVGTYTITASLEGAVSKTATVTVNAVPVPVLVSFTATPSTIVLGEEVTFTCEVEDADAADVVYTIDGNKITSPWTPGAVGTYEITATLAGAAETKTATVTVTAAPEEITWTFYYIGDKSNVHAYVWDQGNSNKIYLGEWPGSAMTYNNGVWEISFTTTDVLVTPMVIFNIGNDTNKTGDLALENGATYDDNGKTEPIDTTNNHTVYFTNSKNWETVSVYAWNLSTDEKYLGDWPGSPAKKINDTTWAYTTTSDLNGAGLIFNNGNNGSQTTDLTWKDNTTYDADGNTTTPTKPVEEVAGFYFVTGTNGNWNECLAMTTTDSITFTYTGPLKGGFKFRLYKESDNGQYGANSDNDLQIEIGKTYGMKSTSSNDAKTFTTPNGNPINVTVEVNRTLNTVRVLPADVYIAGSAVVEKYEASDVGGGSTGWGVSTIQGCDVDMASGTYTWTGYLYDDNGDGDNNSRFKFLLGSGFANGGHLIPDVATTDINYEEAYNLSFSWDDTSDRLFHSNGFDGMETYDGAAVEGETRVKVKAVIDLVNMKVTFYPVEEETFENIFIAGNATEYGEMGRGALEPTTGENGEAVYTAVINFVNADRGFLFPTTESALHPAFVAREDGKVAEHFALQGLDYSFASAPVDNQFKVESAGVYKVEVRPDYNSLYVLPYESTSPADGTYLTVAEKTQTETMTVTFFEKVSDFDASKVIITPETWWMHYNGVHIEGERQVLNKGISGGTVSFGVNSWDGCLTTGETYTITFEQGAVTFAAKGLAERVNPKFSFTVTLAPDTSIGTGIEGVTAENGIAYKNGIVTAEGTIVVYNMSGAVVARGENEVDLNGMNGGVYIVRCNDNVSKVVR